MAMNYLPWRFESVLLDTCGIFRAIPLRLLRPGFPFSTVDSLNGTF